MLSLCCCVDRREDRSYFVRGCRIFVYIDYAKVLILELGESAVFLGFLGVVLEQCLWTCECYTKGFGVVGYYSSPWGCVELGIDIRLVVEVDIS